MESNLWYLAFSSLNNYLNYIENNRFGELLQGYGKVLFSEKKGDKGVAEVDGKNISKGIEAKEVLKSLLEK